MSDKIKELAKMIENREIHIDRDKLLNSSFPNQHLQHVLSLENLQESMELLNKEFEENKQKEMKRDKRDRWNLGLMIATTVFSFVALIISITS